MSDTPTSPAASPPKPAGKRRRRRRRPKGSQEAAMAVIAALERLGQSLIKEQGLDDQGDGLGALTVPIELNLGADEAGRAAAAAALKKQLQARIAEAGIAKAAYRRGHVYCFFCGSAGCEHAHPPSLEHSFARYAPTGQPEWQDFPNLCINRGDPDADRLFASPPGVVALVIPGEDLSERLLKAFSGGHLAFRLLGQLSVGLITTDFAPGSSAPRMTVTLQIVETRGARGLPRLRLNVLGQAWDLIAEAAAEADPRHPAERLRRSVQATRRRIDTLGRQAAAAERRGEAMDTPGRVLVILERLRTESMRIFRRDARRTRHATSRHQQLERPTASAFKDARAASDERLYFDHRHATVVVLGPKGRAHLFSLKGQHVTSLFLKPGEVGRKTGRDRWRPLSRHHINEFRAQIQNPGPEPTQS